MLPLFIFLRFMLGRLHMSPGEFLFWFCLPFVVVIVCIIAFSLQRYEIRITRLFQYLKPLTAEQLHFLKDFKYYRALSPAYRKKFQKRVRHFLVNKTFVARDYHEVSEEMQVLIAAACVQLTFGLRPFYLSSFRIISVYQWQPVHLQDVKNQKELLISWSSFHEGYASPKDGYNPGMEVLALALMLEESLRKKTDKLFGDQAYRNWKIQSRAVAERFIQTGLTPFRNYAQVDKAEFFAVAVVYFFEQPADFHQRFPGLFKAMKKLLGQDPLKFKYKS